MAEQFHADLNIIQSTPIELELLDGDLNIIQQLDDEPNDVGGLTSAELKAKFDQAGNTIKQYINETLIPAVLAADATEDARIAAEAARARAEAERIAAEDMRIAAEAERARAEAERLGAEAERLPAEETRIQAENARAAAEARRTGDELARLSAERERITAENARAAAEQARLSAEAIRAANELLRLSGEADRVQAEAAREVWEPYDNAKTYSPGNKVSYAGGSYLCKLECAGVAPTDPVPEGGAACWLCIAKPGADGDGSGDMLQSVYDPTERNQDVFAYTDEQIGKVRRVYDPSGKNQDVFAYTDGKIASVLQSTVPLTRGGTGQTSADAALFALLDGAPALNTAGLEAEDYVGIGDASASTGRKVTLRDLAAYLVPVAGGAKIEIGSYVGTDTYGKDSPSSITFDFVPQLVVVSRATSSDEGGHVWLRDAKYGISEIEGTKHNSVNLTWEDRTVEWYGTDKFIQLNSSNGTYVYIGIGY